MARFRAQLRERGLPDAETVRRMADGDRTHYVGMVICRQRPDTRTGVTFFTLEDETGFTNLVVWRPIFDRHAPLAKTARLLGVTGRVQSSDGVVHLVAEHLWEPGLAELVEAEATPRSRDFH
jgi:error-prone DNA polymerase